MTHRINYPQIQTLAFAGGGNRCWWQAGVISRLFETGLSVPATLVGTSAGAAVAASCLTDGPEAALRACQRLYLANKRIFDWRSLTRLKLKFAHQETYPAWIESFINAGNFHVLKNARSALLVAVTRPAWALGLAGSVAAGTLAYLIDKKLLHSIHPRLPKFLGLRQEFVSIRDCRTVKEAQTALNAAAAAPPFMSSVCLDGKWAFDGGYADNAPIPVQTPEEKKATLVLLTRHYPKRSVIFQLQGRSYWQPSRPVPVSTWDCTGKSTVEAAFSLGHQDAKHAISSGAFSGA